VLAALQAAAISIMLIGRWLSDACLRYIRKQVEHFLQHVAKINAHILVVSNNTRDCTTSSFDRGRPAAQPPQQCQDETKYGKQHVSMGATASRGRTAH
jgi:hypothetical protein